MSYKPQNLPWHFAKSAQDLRIVQIVAGVTQCRVEIHNPGRSWHRNRSSVVIRMVRVESNDKIDALNLPSSNASALFRAALRIGKNRSAVLTWPSGGIGRRTGLKILYRETG